nr:hypothetical protein [uncultured Rhodopila sp.]
MTDPASDTGFADPAPHRANGGAGEASVASEATSGAERGGAMTGGDDAGAVPDKTAREAAGQANAAPVDPPPGQPAARPPAGRAPVGGKKKIRRGVAVPELLEAAATASEPGQETRFQVFVIDTGWNETAHRVLRKQIPLFDTLTGNTPTYWLNRATSVALLRKHRELIGRDPIVCVHDLRAIKRPGTLGVHGLRLHLGLLRSEDALTRALQMLVHFLARHEVSSNFEAEVHSRLQLEGLKGAIAILAGSTPHNDLLKI